MQEHGGFDFQAIKPFAQTLRCESTPASQAVYKRITSDNKTSVHVAIFFNCKIPRERELRFLICCHRYRSLFSLLPRAYYLLQMRFHNVRGPHSNAILTPMHSHHNYRLPHSDRTASCGLQPCNRCAVVGQASALQVYLLQGSALHPRWTLT